MKNTRLSVLVAVFFVAMSSVFAQNVTIDYRLDLTRKSDSYFNWTLGNNPTIKDSYDAASGASLSETTKKFDAVRYDGANKLTIGSGLRGLLFYPMSAKTTMDFDALDISKSSSGIVIRFVHRDVAYELKTDSKGNLDIQNGIKKVPRVALNQNNTFVLKPEYVKAGGDASEMRYFDWSKAKFVADGKASDASRWYEGTLKLTFEKNILTISGTMKEKK